MYALQLFVCNRDADAAADGLLCKTCAKKSLTHVRHEPRLHGLLTEPIPDDSHIFGGPWYLRMVERFGPPPMEWVMEAEINQKIAEGWVDGAWIAPASASAEAKAAKAAKAQSKVSYTDQGMEKAEKGKKAKKPPAKKEAVPLTTIAPIEIKYKEAAKPIRTFPTDSYTITKGVFRDIPVWILPNGKMYDMDPAGNPRSLLVERYA